VPTSLLIQGEADSTRIDMAARVDGRVIKIPVLRGQNVDAGAVLLQIDNPELLAKLQEAIATKGVAEAELAHIHAGTRAEIVAARKAAVDRAAADAALAEATYERIRKVAATQFASQQQPTRRPIRYRRRGTASAGASPSGGAAAIRRRKCRWPRPKSCRQAVQTASRSWTSWW
jgi:multidrug resistance efflux pump